MPILHLSTLFGFPEKTLENHFRIDSVELFICRFRPFVLYFCISIRAFVSLLVFAQLLRKDKDGSKGPSYLERMLFFSEMLYLGLLGIFTLAYFRSRNLKHCYAILWLHRSFHLLAIFTELYATEVEHQIHLICSTVSLYNRFLTELSVSNHTKIHARGLSLERFIASKKFPLRSVTMKYLASLFYFLLVEFQILRCVKTIYHYAGLDVVALSM